MILISAAVIRANSAEFHCFSSDFMPLYQIRTTDFFSPVSFCSQNNKTTLKSRPCSGVRHHSCKRNEKNPRESHLLSLKSCFPDFSVLLPVLGINMTGEAQCQASAVISGNIGGGFIEFNWRFSCQEGENVGALGHLQTLKSRNCAR